MREPDAVSTYFSQPKFFQYIAHELANPLNGMLVSVGALESYAEANPGAMDEIGDLLGILRNELNRLVLLLNELRSSGVLRDIALQPTSLPAEISELLALESAYYEQRQVRINLDIPLDLPGMMADRNKLRQVLLNLCKNAVEAMPNGGTLTIRCWASEAWLCLDITDTGNGIPAGMPVFEPAVTDKPQGSGLGLAIVREMVHQHKGTVSYTTELGKGTTFHLKFPIPADSALNSEEKPQAWREDYRRRNQEGEYRWSGDSRRLPLRNSGTLIDIAVRQPADHALQLKDAKSPMEIANTCSAALRLLSTGLFARAAAQGVDPALFSTAFEYGLKGIKASPKLFAGNMNWSARLACFNRRSESSQKCLPRPKAGSSRKT